MKKTQDKEEVGERYANEIQCGSFLVASDTAPLPELEALISRLIKRYFALVKELEVKTAIEGGGMSAVG